MDLQGHRGARGLLPENTLPGFARALEIGVTTLELDVGVTRDGVVVIHHDRRLNGDVARIGDKWVTVPAPTIHQLTFAELQKYDVGRIRPGSEYAARFAHQKPIDGVRVPRLADLFDLVKQSGNSTVRFNIETKLHPDAPTETPAPEPFARALVAEIRKAGLASRANVQSFDFRTLKVVEREAPEIATAYLTSGKQEPGKVHAAGARLWSPSFAELTPAALVEVRRLGMKIVVWTVNENSDIDRMLDLGVDGIISDYPDRVRTRMQARGLPLPR